MSERPHKHVGQRLGRGGRASRDGSARAPDRGNATEGQQLPPGSINGLPGTQGSYPSVQFGSFTGLPGAELQQSPGSGFQMNALGFQSVMRTTSAPPSMADMGHMNFVPPQGAYPAGPGGYPFYPYAPANNFQAGVSYSASPPGLPAGFAPPQPYTAPARQPAAKSKAIKIIDPATNQEVMLGKQAEAKRIASEQKRAAASAAAGGLGGSKLSGALPASQPKPFVSGVSGATSAPFAAPSSFIKTMSWAKVASQPSSDADKPQVEEAKPIGIRTPAAAGAAGEGSEEAGRAAPALSAKAKRKAALERAEAASGQGDFMDAYTEHKEAPPEPAAKAAPLAPPPSTAQTTPVDEEVDDWETAAEGVPTPRAKAPHAPADDTKRLQYSRDWLMTFQSACIRKPEGLEQGETSMILRDGSGDGGRQAFDMAPRRAPPRAGPPPPPADADSRWKNRGMPMAGPGGPPGMPGMMGPGGRMMGTGRGLAGKQGIEGDKWQRGPLPPAPPGGGARAPVLHKSENRYEVGKVLSDDPDEERKQKEIKSLLNKVTPEKFDKIFDQMVAVGIATPKTLRGLINQVFDKALTEPTFCEIYAKLCLKLNEELPDFEDDTEVEPEDGRPRQPLTLRRLLLNKCQEEFEKGDAAMAAVDAREKADREKSEAQDQKAGEEGKEASTSGTDAAPGAAGEGEKEEGELAADDKLRLRREEALRAEEELKGRRRMLGNIQFIGQLYKYKMLTEKIMHTCIRKLLGEIDNPKREDVECLCKLLSTVGRQLDESKTGKGQGRQHMDAYFQRIQRLAQSPKLDSRIRFMLQDTIELRHAQWVERRKVEGPKTIEEIHADARNELNKQRLQGGDRRGPRETFPPRGREPPPARRFDDSKVDAPIRTMRSNTDFAGSLRPGGGGAPSFRPGGGPPAVRAAQPSQRESLSTAAAPAARVPSPAPVPAAHPAAAAQPALTDQQLLTRAKTIIAELAANKNLKDADICIRELAEQAGNVVRLVEKVVQAVLEAKAVDLHSFSDVLVQLVQSAEALLSAAELQKGLEAVVDTLDQVAIDVPKAPGVMGELVGLLAGAGLVDLVGLARRALSAGRTQEGDAEEEEGGLVDDGYAVDLVGRALQTQAAQLGQDTMLKCWQAGGLDFIAFLPEYERDDDKALQKIAQKYSLRKLLKLPSPEEHVASAIAQGTSAEELRAWIDSNAKGSWSDPAFVRAIILSTLQTAVPAPQATDLSKSFRTGNATLERCLPLLQQLSNQNSPRTVQEAAVLAAQDYFEASNCLKGLMVRLLEDLRDWGLVSAPAFAHWQYDSKSQRAVMDAHRFLDEIKHQEAEEEET
ncbi:hypothetical protein WJX72_005497 [[Myrmecia] bisecta]|uniref:MI domain-containing protein n=1 Tax=[Myrmecia] bisecta TaxID=41462 RepID=A0AAW1QF30_9CHLO